MEKRIQRILEIRKELFDIANSYSGYETGTAAIYLHESCNCILFAYKYLLKNDSAAKHHTTAEAINTAGDKS